MASGRHPALPSPTTAACISRVATARAPPRTTTATASCISARICDSSIRSHPRNWAALNRGDVDLGSTGPVLLPGNRVFQVGKGGIGYLLDAEHLGGIGGQLHSGTVCNDGRAFGGVAHDGNTLFVPCSNGVVQVTVSGDTFNVGWTAPLSKPGPTIIAGGAVWTVATSDGDLIALDAASGKTITSESIGTVPSQFTSPAAGLGLIVVGSERKLSAFGP